jgi:glycosyltransferase involved in cell wall biosynthesis
MRIAMIGVRGIPAHLGGAEHVVEELTRELTARGHEVLVYCRRSYVAGLPAPTFGRQIFTPYLHGKHVETITHTAASLVDVLGRHVDVIHLHSPGPALLSWLPRLAGIPLVLTVHAPDWLRDKWSRPAKAALRFGLACGMRRANEVTAVNKSLAEQLSAEFGREVHYVPNGVRPVQLRPAKAIARWGLDKCRYALTVGRVVPEKRLDLLLKTWGDLSDSDKAGVRLVVVGDIDATSYGRSCRAKGGSDVMFLGVQYGEILSELYSNTELVIHPSSLEGMSLVLLEAAAYGRCILASDLKVTLDSFGDCMVYYRGEESSDLVREIGRLLRSEELRRAMGNRARSHVLQSYDWSAIAQRMKSIYCRAIERAQG